MTATYDEPPADDEPGPGRVPPQDLDAERAVLGGMMLSSRHFDSVGDVVSVLQGRDFYRPAHETIFDAIVDLYGRGEPTDPIKVAAALLQRGEINRVGGPSYLHTLVSSVPTAANAEWYAQIVHERAVLRRLVEAGTRIVQMGYDGEGPAGEIADAASAELFAAVETQTDSDPEKIATQGTIDGIEERANQKSMSGTPTGFLDLDSLTNGWQPGRMITVAARPAMGKSTFAIDAARACAIRHGIPAVIFSLEMGRREIEERVLAAEGKIPFHHITSGQMTEDDWAKIARVQPRIDAAPLFIDDSPDLTMLTIRSKCRKLVARYGRLGLVVIDYLQLMRSGARRVESRQVEVSEMSRSTKLLAKELQVPVMVLSQLNRGPEQRSDKKPMVSDLRESGSIEQDSDLVILLHREDAYEKASARSGEADLIVGKNRSGPTTIITVAFQGHFARFADMAQT